MPDGDIVHSGLSGIYQKPYRILCEEKLEPNELTRIITKALLKDIKNKGAAPILLGKHMGKLLGQVIKNSGKNQFLGWTDLSKKLDRLAQQANIQNRTKSFVLNAGKSILHDLRYGKIVNTASTSTIQTLVIERYMQQVYVSNFEQRIPLTLSHHNNLDHITVTERVKALQPDIFSQINKWAKKANLDEDVANLRRTRRSQVKKIDLEENLL